MEAKKLEAKIEDWAASLGFTLPGDSAPPPHYFSLFTATPHRRQLWQVIIESVQDRRKIENIRKQLFVFSVKQRRKNEHDSSSGMFSCKLHLYDQQKALENKIIEKKKEIEYLKKKILSKASDFLFDALKMTEIQKQNDDLRKKALALRLMNRQQNMFIEQLGNYLLSIDSCKNHEENLLHIEDGLPEDKFLNLETEIYNIKLCKSDIFHECPLQKKIDAFCKSGKKLDSIWATIVMKKKEGLDKFSHFLKQLPCTDTESPQDPEKNSEENLKISVENLKQEICFKSLQAMITDSETGLLEWEIQKLIKRIENIYFKYSEKSLSSNPSFLLDEVLGKSFDENTNSLEEIKNQVNLLGLKKYEGFLKCEISKLDNEILKEQEDFAELTDGKKEFQQSLSEINSLVQEIKDGIAEQNEQNKQISRLLNKIDILILEAENQLKNRNFVSEVQETIHKLKINSKKQFEAFIETPMDAIETAAEFSVGTALKEIERRKIISDELENYIAEKKKLSERLKEAFMKMNSFQYDSNIWEKNYEDCQKILCNILRKAKFIPEEIEFTEKILSNWLLQPYRSMIDESETVNGMTLKDYEDLCKKK